MAKVLMASFLLSGLTTLAGCVKDAISITRLEYTGPMIKSIESALIVASAAANESR